MAAAATTAAAVVGVDDKCNDPEPVTASGMCSAARAHADLRSVNVCAYLREGGGPVRWHSDRRIVILDVDSTIVHTYKSPNAQNLRFPWMLTERVASVYDLDLAVFQHRHFSVSFRPGLMYFGAALRAAGVTDIILASKNSTSLVPDVASFLTKIWCVTEWKCAVHFFVFHETRKKSIHSLSAIDGGWDQAAAAGDVGVALKDRIVVYDDQPNVWRSDTRFFATLTAVTPWTSHGLTSTRFDTREGTSDEIVTSYGFTNAATNRRAYSCVRWSNGEQKGSSLSQTITTATQKEETQIERSIWSIRTSGICAFVVCDMHRPALPPSRALPFR